MAKCEICGKTIRSGMSISHSHIRMETQSANCTRYCRRYPQKSNRLHQVPAFRQSKPGYLIKIAKMLQNKNRSFDLFFILLKINAPTKELNNKI